MLTTAGLLILGLYIFCTESGYQSVLAQLCAALTAMIAAQNIYPAGKHSAVPTQVSWLCVWFSVAAPAVL